MRGEISAWASRSTLLPLTVVTCGCPRGTSTRMSTGTQFISRRNLCSAQANASCLGHVLPVRSS